MTFLDQIYPGIKIKKDKKKNVVMMKHHFPNYFKSSTLSLFPPEEIWQQMVLKL